MSDQPAITLEQFHESASAIMREVGKIIVGQDEVIKFVLICVISGNHALLEGVPGLGKTTLIRALATALRLKFSRIQFTPDMMPADVTGTTVMEENEEGRRQFRFQEGPLFANLVLADEINRATPKTQSALLEAMQEKTITVGNRTYKLEPPFFCAGHPEPFRNGRDLSLTRSAVGSVYVPDRRFLPFLRGVGLNSDPYHRIAQ